MLSPSARTAIQVKISIHRFERGVGYLFCLWGDSLAPENLNFRRAAGGFVLSFVVLAVRSLLFALYFDYVLIQWLLVFGRMGMDSCGCYRDAGLFPI